MSQLISSIELLKSISDATTALVQKLSKSVVSINAQMSRGTGVVLDKQGYIVTCNHVLGGCNQVRVGQGEKTFEARVIGTDTYHDVALLKTDQGGFEPIELGDSGGSRHRAIRFGVSKSVQPKTTNSDNWHCDQPRQ